MEALLNRILTLNLIFGFPQLNWRSISGLGFQYYWHNRFARCDQSGVGLRRARIYETGLFDSRVLGSCSAGYP